MEMMLNKIVPEGLPYRHSCEGPDDMVSVMHSLLICIHYSKNRSKLMYVEVRFSHPNDIFNGI